MKEFKRGGLSDEKTITGFYKGIGIAHKGLKRREEETGHPSLSLEEISYKMDRETKQTQGGGYAAFRRPMHFAFPLRMGFLKYNGIGHGSNYKSQMDI